MGRRMGVPAPHNSVKAKVMCIHTGGASDDTTGPLRQMRTCVQDAMHVTRHREGEHILYWKFQI